tara:strand:+ start:34 stop:567 length:534 start_codon:yes stop_codon:yes gene_type:complete
MIAKTLSRLGIEVWKDIPEYEGFYQVSNLGNVKSLRRVDSIDRKVKEKVLKANKSSSGYFSVRLSKHSIGKVINIHQLVCITFLNHKPCGHKLVVNHIDANPKNNNLNNLEIITQRKNSNRKHIKSSSKYVGVSWSNSSKKWKSAIKINGKTKHLGFFIDELEASRVYQNELNKIEL